MKQTTLEDLYYGNINLNEISFVRGSEYGKCFDKVTELSKSVCSQLTEEYINKMNELESAYTRILSETEREYFISGFKLGAKKSPKSATAEVLLLKMFNCTINVIL